MSLTSSKPTVAHADDFSSGGYRLVRALIWIYIFFLLFEGVLRKWVLPGLSGPLVIIRDPIVVAIYLAALCTGLFPKDRFLIALAGVVGVVSVFGLFAEKFSPSVYAFGWRSNFLHLPLIFLMARVMTRRHVVQVGWWWLAVSVPMSYLIAKQFEGGADTILNTTAGQTGLQINTSGGKLRASGTFSFVSGVVTFCSLVASYVFYGLLRSKTYPIWLSLMGAGSLALSVATSGSRSAAMALAVVGAAGLCGAAMNPQLLLRAILCIPFLAVVYLAVLQLDVVKEGVEVMSLRFEEAGSADGGVFSRFSDELFVPFYSLSIAPLVGHGLGLGTNAGAFLATGEISFLLAEGEHPRVILESGPIGGLLFVLWRTALVVLLAIKSVRSLKGGDALALLLLGASGLNLWNGQFGQPTMLGFAVIGGGLCLAATNTPATAGAEAPPTNPAEPKRRRRSARVRGRARYAELLHRNE